MTLDPATRRTLGTMVVYGYPDLELDDDLAIARQLGATVVEALPLWRSLPDPAEFRRRLGNAGLSLHSAHGCWGGQTIRSARVDLGSTDPKTRRNSVDDLTRCLDWLSEAGGICLVVHPGGLSDAHEVVGRRDALAAGLIALSEHAGRTPLTVCVENMPPGVFPGSRMSDLAGLVSDIGRPNIALALDTGHARLNTTPYEETLAAGSLLRTTHVHDNDGRQDTHHPPGLGTIDWDAWARSLDAIDYRGPVILECIRHLRKNPETLSERLLDLLDGLCGVSNV